MVDTEFAPLSDKIVAAIKQVSGAPIRFMVNTHVHPDHTGGNENFGKMGVVSALERPASDPAGRRSPACSARCAGDNHL